MPDISIVVVSLVGGTGLKRCLGSLPRNAGEIIVMADESKVSFYDLQEKFTDFRFESRKGMSVPLARSMGVRLATGKIVALLEDTGTVSPSWLSALEQAFENASVFALGGPVVLSTSLGSRYKALGSGEYGRFHPDCIEALSVQIEKPGTMFSVERIPGNNMAYRRDTLLPLLDDEREGLIENQISEQLKTNGEILFVHREMIVTYEVEDVHGACLTTRFNHGRLFAGNRAADLTWKYRFIWALKSLLLPILLSVRGWKGMLKAVRAASWPTVAAWIVLMETAWAAGEACGYLKGKGKSLEAWV